MTPCLRDSPRSIGCWAAECGVEGAAELIVAKNRNGPTGFVDLYFYHKWMRFEDMLDPDR